MHLQRTQFFQKAASTTDPSIASPAVSYDGTQAAEAATFYTSPIFVGDALGWFVMAGWADTGTPVGVLTVEVSVDEASGQNVSPQAPDASLTDWIAVQMYDPASAVYVGEADIADSGKVAVEYNGSFARWVRLKWTRTSGTWTPRLKLQKKGVS